MRDRYKRRGRLYLGLAACAAAVLVIVQVAFPLVLAGDQAVNPAIQFVSLLTYWAGIPLVAGLLTAGILLTEIGRLRESRSERTEVD